MGENLPTLGFHHGLLVLVSLSVGLALIACAAKPAGELDGPPNSSGVATIEAEPDQGAKLSETPAPAADETVEIDGVQLGLVADECLLTAEVGEQRLVHRFAFPAACSFATDSSGTVRIVATDTGKAVMVQSSKPLEHDCDTATRVVVITGEGPRVSKAVQRMAMCAPFEWDEMMFHVLASEPVAFGTPGAAP